MNTTQKNQKKQLNVIADVCCCPLITRKLYQLMKGALGKDMNIKEASEFYNVSEQQLRNRINRNQIPFIKTSNGIMVCSIDVNIYLHYGSEFLEWLNDESHDSIRTLASRKTRKEKNTIEMLVLETHIIDHFIPSVNNIIEKFLRDANDKPISLETAADMMGITTCALRSRVKRGKLPYYKIGGSIYLFTSDLSKHIRMFPGNTY